MAANAEEATLERELEQTPEAVEGGEDVGALRPGQVARALGRVVSHLDNVARESRKLSVDLVKVALGRSEVEPDRKDWRFSDATWKENPLYRRLAQAYILWSSALERLVEEAGLDWRTAEQARFGMTVLTTAAAPTNSLPGNPAAMKRALETGGKSLARGAGHFVDDLRHNGGMPRMVDPRPFKLGENIAGTPGAVVYRDDVCEVIQYTPSTPTVRSVPVLQVPPQINKYYFMDLGPKRSFIAHAVAKGIPYFTISWRNPTSNQGDLGLDDYVATVLQAADVVCDVARSDRLHVFGLCAGGITTTAMLGHLAATGDERVASATYGVTMLDFSVPSMVGMLGDERLITRAKRHSKRRGVLDGRSLSQMFAFLRPNDLVWNYWVNNYLMGNEPPAFDILAWNSDSTRLAGALHGDFLDIFLHNSFCTPGALTVLGTPIDLSKVECDNFVLGGRTDHLTPWKACYQTTQLLGGPSEFVLAPVGHIQTLVFPPGNPKAKYYVGPAPGPDPDKWVAAATERPDTWWDYWAEWIIARSGDEREAPGSLGSRRYPPSDPAPGRYVFDK